MALPPHLADLEQRLASRFAEAVAEFRRSAEEQLRRDSERWLGAMAELPAPPSGGWIAESDLAGLELAPRSEATREVVDRLSGALRGLDLAHGQSEALDALLDGAHAWAKRVALVLARDSGLASWGDRGFGDSSFAGRELDWDALLRERLLASRGCLRLDAESAAEVLARFGASAAGPAVIVPLVLRDRIAALLWADGGESAPELGALQILVHAAGQRLELQALSDRAYSPTLWEGADAPGEPLPLWSVLAPAAPSGAAEPGADSALVETAPPPAPEADDAEAAEESASHLWQAEAPALDDGEPASAPTATDELTELATSYAELSESASAPGEALPPEPALADESEPMPEFELESSEPPGDDEAARWEPDPTAAETAAVEIEPAPVEVSPAPLDMLGTVRMQLPVAEEPARPREETTAPLPIVAPSSPASTHEIELPAEVAPPADDASDDATQLSMRRPPIPEAPAPVPPPATTVAIDAPTWSAAPIAPPPPPAPAPPPADDPMDRTGARFGRSTEVAPPPDVSGPGLAFLAGRAARASSDPAHEEAKRLARLLISEIRLYNEEQVLEGRRHRDLYHRLKDDIDRSRQIFDERVDPAVRDEIDYFQQELVRSLAGGDARALGI